jgi:hypothetical protein
MRALRWRVLFATILALVTLSVLLPPEGSASVPANGRAWELVTPADAVSATVVGMAPSDAGGNRLAYASIGAMPGAQSGLVLSVNLAERGEDGWTSTPFSFPFSGENTEFLAALIPILPVTSPEGGVPPAVWMSTVPLSPAGPPEGGLGLYRQGPGNTFTLIAHMGSPEGGIFNYNGFVDQSQDSEHVIFSSSRHLVAADAGRAEGSSIYESVGTSSLRLVDVDGGGGLLSPCGSVITPTRAHGNGVSLDGERIFFTNPDPGTSCPGPSAVYLREGGSSTVEISESQCTRLDCNAPDDVTFAGATPDGAVAYMTTVQQLTNDDTDSLRDLYRYQLNGGELTLASDGPPAATGAVSTKMVHVSDDGSYAYFYADGQLLPGEGSESGANIYLSAPGGLRFVAAGAPSFMSETQEDLQVTPDGRAAIFSSVGATDPGDTDGRQDVYLYDAEGDELIRISKGPAGGNGEFTASIVGPEQLFVFGRPLLFRALTDDGQDAFFYTEERLVPEDADKNVDVYEWKEGQLGLISSGEAKPMEEGSTPLFFSFNGVTPDGKTAFFVTSESLIPADRDGGNTDLYAARVGGGFAEPPAQPPGCQGVPCRPSAPPPISRSVPASATHRERKREKAIRLLKILDDGRGGPTLLVAVPSAGRVSAVATQPGGKAAQVVARGSAGAIRPGKVRIPLLLSGVAARALGRGDALKVRLVIRAGGKQLTRMVSLTSGSSR